jgi:hypothetical protein
MSKYDDARLRQEIRHIGLSVAGTNAAAADLLRVPVAGGNIKVNKARLRLTTGGTAAGPVVTFNKSVGGTGALSPIGTYTCGTSANGAVASVTLTSTEFDADDELVLQVAAGTAASTPVLNLALGFNDLA